TFRVKYTWLTPLGAEAGKSTGQLGQPVRRPGPAEFSRSARRLRQKGYSSRMWWRLWPEQLPFILASIAPVNALRPRSWSLRPRRDLFRDGRNPDPPLSVKWRTFGEHSVWIADGCADVSRARLRPGPRLFRQTS